MRVLLDQQLPCQLAREITGPEIGTVQQRGVNVFLRLELRPVPCSLPGDDWKHSNDWNVWNCL